MPQADVRAAVGHKRIFAHDTLHRLAVIRGCDYATVPRLIEANEDDSGLTSQFMSTRDGIWRLSCASHGLLVEIKLASYSIRYLY